MTALKDMSGKQKTLTGLLALIATMTALVWASPTLYDLFCRVTGFGGTPLVADYNDNEVLDATMNIRFDASLQRGMPWEFEPVERKIEVRIGETNLAYYEATNPTDRPVAGSATFNLTPYAAQGYFTKIECFCFEVQVLQPGETVQMPVSFFVDPAILEDSEGKYVSTITLSYTFHEIPLPEDAVPPKTPESHAMVTGTQESDTLTASPDHGSQTN